MSLRASDAEATALGMAAAAGAAFATHVKGCLTCSRARQAGKLDQSCDTGYDMIRTVHDAERVLRQLRADKKARRALQRGLF